jgi:hypothetical protein
MGGDHGPAAADIMCLAFLLSGNGGWDLRPWSLFFLLLLILDAFKIAIFDAQPGNVSKYQGSVQ